MDSASRVTGSDIRVERTPRMNPVVTAETASARVSAVRLEPMLMAALLCALFTLPAAWISRQLISADGLSYLEMAVNAITLSPRYLFVNAYWSPAYPALLAGVLAVIHPSTPWELAIVHSLDWIVCLGTCFCFTYFLFNLLRWIEVAQGIVFESRAAFYAFLGFTYTLLCVSNLDQSLWLAGPTS